jgi:hypothetical protein
VATRSAGCPCRRIAGPLMSAGGGAEGGEKMLLINIFQKMLMKTF